MGEPGWPRAVALTVAVLVALTGIPVVGANTIVTRLTGVDRGTRVAFATVWFFTTLALAAYGLRRLQARHVL